MGKSKAFFHLEGLCSLAWHLDYLHFFRRPSGRIKLLRDAARSRSVNGRYQGHRGQMSRSLCNLIGQTGTNSTIYNIFLLKWGKMVREKHQIIDKILTLPAQNTHLIKTGYVFAKSTHVNGNVESVSLAFFFKVSSLLPDWIVKIKTD